MDEVIEEYHNALIDEFGWSRTPLPAEQCLPEPLPVTITGVGLDLVVCRVRHEQQAALHLRSGEDRLPHARGDREVVLPVSHPDRRVDQPYGIVEVDLGLDGLPVYANSSGGTDTTSVGRWSSSIQP